MRNLNTQGWLEKARFEEDKDGSLKFEPTYHGPPSPQEQLLALVPGLNEIEEEVNADEAFNDAGHGGILLHMDQSRADPFVTYPIDGSCRQVALLVDHGKPLSTSRRPF